MVSKDSLRDDLRFRRAFRRRKLIITQEQLTPGIVVVFTGW